MPDNQQHPHPNHPSQVIAWLIIGWVSAILGCSTHRTFTTHKFSVDSTKIFREVLSHSLIDIRDTTFPLPILTPTEAPEQPHTTPTKAPTKAYARHIVVSAQNATTATENAHTTLATIDTTHTVNSYRSYNALEVNNGVFMIVYLVVLISLATVVALCISKSYQKRQS